MSTRGKRRHSTRWVAGAVLVILASVGVVLATRTPQEATQVQSPLVGRMAPLFSGADLRHPDGQRVSLRALRGRYVFVNFFASWCGPCQQEAPDLISFFYQNAQKDRADLISVVFHDQVASAESFLKSQGASWAAVNDPGGTIAQNYGVTGPPTTFLIDPSGRITVAPETGPATQADLERMLQQARKRFGHAKQRSDAYSRARSRPLWMRVGLPVIVLAVALVIGSGALSGKATTDAQRATAIESVVRCPSCIDVSVAQSEESTALAVRHEIERQVAKGRSSAQIEQTLVSQYGLTILLEPPSSAGFPIIWVLPVVFGAGALGVVAVLFWRRSRQFAATKAEQVTVGSP